MIRKILVGLDGSTDSQSAIEQGIHWAQRTGAELIGLGVVDEPTICGSEAVGAWGSYYKARKDKKRLADARVKVRGFLDEFSARCRASGVRCQLREETGLPSERILHINEDVDLTLLGHESHFHFETQREPDNTVEHVLRRMKRPVVTVSNVDSEKDSTLVAYDASPASARALAAFATSGLSGGRTVQVVSVAKDVGLAQRRADEAVRFLGHFSINAETTPIVGRKVSESLLEQVRDRQPGLVVMGAFGGQRTEGLFGGSTTRQMLRNANVALFLHP